MSINLRYRAGTLSLLLLFFCIGGAYGHDSRPVYVDIRESGAGHFVVHWKAPVSLPARALPSLRMPASCRQNEDAVSGHTGDAYTVHGRYSCPGGLSGQTLSLDYPGSNPGLSTLIRVGLLSGETHTRVLDPGEESWTVPEDENVWQVSKQYAGLGIEHIFAGIDHLLFVACLIFIARTPRRILVTVTGFTLAHSLTLALATLGIVALPVAAVEAVIALSIVFLAHEIAVANPRSWTWRYPILVSGSFGLLHGFGFAAVLGDIGLPQTELPAALLFFNVGVEVGQILFIAAIALIVTLGARLLRRTRQQLLDRRWTGLAGSYIIGSLASFWLVQRMADF